jgi:hypothetical protein
MTDFRELPNVITPLSIEAVWNALLLRWETLGVPVVRAAVELKLAHIHLETGLKSCHCWNVGNVKYASKYPSNCTFFACGEEVGGAGLQSARSYGPHLVEVKKQYSGGNGAPRHSLWLKPPHPWTKFAAFESLADGIEFQFGYLKRHPGVLAALQTGDPKTYNDALVAASYYTAGQSQYLATLKQRLEMVRRETAGYDWGDVA